MRKGFTLIEITVTIIIIGAMAALALPRIGQIAERMRATEGEQILTVLLHAQNDYQLDNNGSYTNDPTELAIEYAAADFKHFVHPPTVGNPIASVTRLAGDYTLSIDNTGTISCTPGGAGPYTYTCAQAGY